MKKLILGILFLVLGWLPLAGAQEEENKVQLSLVADVESIQPGVPFNLGIYFQIEKGWHTYYKDPGEAGAPPQFQWKLPKGFKLESLQWPQPLKLIEPGDIKVNAYKNELLLTTKVVPPNKISSQKIQFQLQANWLVCENVCIPELANVSLVLPVSASAPLADNQELFLKKEPKESKGVEGQLWKFLLFAFIGGMILNVMPCVLPVISLKIFSFVQMAQENRKKMAALGSAFTAGVLFSFILLATAVSLLKTLGQDIGWGFQFQHPQFVIILTSVVFVLGLSLAGVFELTLSVPQKGATLAQKEGIGGAFFYGILATVLATPCTAPFVGVTIGFAFSNAVWVIFLIFIMMGVGLSFPFLLLSLNPAWTRYVPKPGPWMNLFKQLMSFLLFATVVWLLWLVGRQTQIEGLISVLAFLLCLSLAAWVWGQVQFLERQKRIFWSVTLALFLLITGKVFVSPALNVKSGSTELKKEEGIAWIKYNPKQFQQFLKEGKPVFLDFTADWCLTCKVNEKTVLTRDDVVDAFEKQNIVPIKLDWTFQDKEVTQLLKSFNRYGVPLYVYYPNGSASEPILLPEVLTKQGLLDVLKSDEEKE